MMIIVIGRGHSGTRSIAQTLYASNVYMGSLLNNSCDFVPPHNLYRSCHIFSKYVKYSGNYKWDFSEALGQEVPQSFKKLIQEYLKPILESTNEFKGWKLPETTLIYPWIYNLFPDAFYIFWSRHPFDSILGRHLTDDLHDFSVDYPVSEDVFQNRAISWLYQYEIQKCIPKPKNSIEVRFEDFVLNQETTISRLKNFLGKELARIPMRPDSLHKWRGKIDPAEFSYLFEAMNYYDYSYE